MTAHTVPTADTTPARTTAQSGAPNNSTNKQPPQSREVVLAAAHELIRRHGFAGLSMRELARESGLAKATLYHHFEDKQDVIRSVIMQDLELVQRRIIEAATSPANVEDRLRDIIATYLGLLVERGMIVLQLLRESSMLETDLCDILRRYRQELLQPVMLVIQEAVDSGQARPVNVEFAVASMFGMIHSFVTHHFLLEGMDLGGDVVDHIHSLFLHGLMMPGAEEASGQNAPSTTTSSTIGRPPSPRTTANDHE